MAPDERWKAGIMEQKPLYSALIRTGISETLVLLGLFGKQVSTVPHAANSADLIVRKLLQKADAVRWWSLSHQLPIFAEASPEEFIEAVEDSLGSERPSDIHGTLRRRRRYLRRQRHTMRTFFGALETLAWISHTNLLASGRRIRKKFSRQWFIPDPRTVAMETECTPELFEFLPVDRRSVVAAFDGGTITSNAGALLMGLVDRGLGLMRRVAGCFTDRRDPLLSSIRWRRWWGSGFSAWRWATRTSTITTSCARIRHWRCWRANWSRCGVPTARRWLARARSIGWSTPRRARS